MKRTTRCATGFSLLDLLVTMAIMAIALAITIPGFTPDDAARLQGGADMVASDVEYAQSISLATPSDPAAVVFDLEANTYWIALQSDLETPIEMPGADDEDYLVTLGSGRAALLYDVELTLEGGAEDVLSFDEFTRLETLGGATITLTNPGGAVDITISSSTGAVHVVWQ